MQILQHPTHVARLEFPRETDLILRCAGKAGNPFQTIIRGATSNSQQGGDREAVTIATESEQMWTWL